MAEQALAERPASRLRTAGWRRTVEVLSPLELRRELARIGAELVEYNDDASTTHPTQGGIT